MNLIFRVNHTQGPVDNELHGMARDFLLCVPQNYFYSLMHRFTWKTTASTSCVPNTIIGILLNKSDPVPIHTVYSKRVTKCIIMKCDESHEGNDRSQ